VHALGTGTDTRDPVFLLLTGACGAVVLAAAAWRIRLPGPAGIRVTAGLVVVVLAAAIALWAAWGPLEPGWAKRSGTPSSLLPAYRTGSAPGDGE
jgi:MFS superfamily sulfate permease-like transporter